MTIKHKYLTKWLMNKMLQNSVSQIYLTAISQADLSAKIPAAFLS